jgi:hypothetical protein
LEGEPETLTFTATQPGPYYLILDNFLGGSGPAGDYTLTGFLDCPPSRWVNVNGYTNSGPGLGAAWADCDNDGDLDLYLPKYGEANQLLENNGAGSLNSVTNPVLNDTGNGRGAAWGDFDNDGDLDLYLSNALSANKLFENDGTGVFSEVTNSPVNDVSDGRGVAWADYDNDGDLDLYLANAYAANKLFENDGTGGFSDVTSSPLDDTGNATGVAWADYDNDGDLDLYLSNGLSANKLFRNDGAAGFSDVTTGILGDTGDGRGVAWGDYDNDGDLDLYLANARSANKLFDNDGAGGFTDATTAVLGDGNSGQAVASADFDDDGDLDIYLVNAYNFDRLFRNDLPADNHWLHVDVEGLLSNRTGIGARVRVVTGDVSQIREVTGGSGYLSQSSLTAEFGLGSATLADTVEVVWPSGLTQVRVAVAADQRILMNEHDAAVDVEDLPLPRHLTRLSNVPDPFNPATEIRYLLPGPSAVSITIYDIRGRAVRHLFDGPQGTGLQRVVWNGANDAGASLSSGTYVAHIATAYGSDTEKLTLLK